MNDMNSFALNDPSMIKHSMMPSIVIAGRIEYLYSSQFFRYRQLEESVNTPFSSCEYLLSAGAKAFKRPCPVAKVSPSVACAFVDENQLLWSVVGADVEPVLGPTYIIPLHGVLCYLRRHQVSWRCGSGHKAGRTSFIRNPARWSVLQIVDSVTVIPQCSSSTSLSLSRYKSLRRVTEAKRNCKRCSSSVVVGKACNSLVPVCLRSPRPGVFLLCRLEQA